LACEENPATGFDNFTELATVAAGTWISLLAEGNRT
jgi:hypothetical protein